MGTGNTAKIIIVLGIYGPYHLARFKSSTKHSKLNVIGIEISGQKGDTQIEGWRALRSEQENIVTLFPHTDYWKIPRPLMKREVCRTLQKYLPDAVAVNGWAFPETHVCISWARQNKRAVVLMSDSNETDYRRAWWKEYVKSRIVRLCDAALVAALPQAEYVAKLGIPRENIFLGYNAVDNKYFTAQANEIRRQKSEIRVHLGLQEPFVLTVTRFIPEKNLVPAMQAYARYVSHIGSSAWKWVLCGDGPLKNELLRLREQIGVENHINFPGFVKYDDLPKYYAFAKFFWLPSIKDTWGLVVNEAMASGLPVAVSKRLGCASTLIEEGENGWIFNPNSIEQMTEVLIRMHQLSNEQRATMGRRSRQIISNWGLQRFAEGLYNSVQTGLEHAKNRKTGFSLIDRFILRI